MALIPPIVTVMEKACKNASKSLIRDFGELEKLQISRKDMNDFDYHIEDLRSIYPNQLVYKTDMGKLPFFSKTLIENSRTEKSSAIKIGDCNITYSFIKPQLGNLAEVHGLFGDPRLEQIDALLTSTYIRHNNPSKFSKKAMMEGESNVVKFTNK